MFKKNLFYITRTNAGYCAKYEDRLFNEESFLTSSSSDRKSARYVSFPDLIDTFVNAPRKWYGGGVILKFDKNSRYRIPDNEKKVITSLVKTITDFVTEIENHDSVLTSIRELVQGRE